MTRNTRPGATYNSTIPRMACGVPTETDIMESIDSRAERLIPEEGSLTPHDIHLPPLAVLMFKGEGA